MASTKILIKSLISSSTFNALHFRYFKISRKSIHSFHQFKPRSSITKNLEKKECVKDPKVYMRDTISNIYKILKYSSWDTAKDQISKLGIKWDSYTVNQVLKTHPPMQKAWLFFNWVSGLKGFKHDQFTYTTMLDIFGEAGRIASMNHVFKQMQEKGIKIDAVTYTSLMHWVSNSGDIDGGIKIWEDMKENGCFPSVVSYTAYMKILFDNNRVQEATDVYKEMLESGISPNCYTYTVLMEYLIVAGKYEEALDIFSQMQEAGVQPDKALCNILVERCCKTGATNTMTQILYYMRNNHLTLRCPVFLDALKTLRNAGESESLLRQVNPHISSESIDGYNSFNSISNPAEDSIEQGLLLILLKKQNLVAVDRLLAEIIDQNILLDSWIVSTIVEVNCSRNRPDGALLAFEYSVGVGIVIERTTYLSLIGSLIRSSTFLRVVEVVKEMLKAGHPLELYLSALLIYRLGSARRTTCAAKIFNLLPVEQKCTATFTAMISVYFSVGSADKALKIYKTMQKKGIKPSLGTYHVLLSGLEKCGRISEIDTYRKEKKCLMATGYCSDSVPMEEKISDLLFAGGLVS